MTEKAIFNDSEYNRTLEGNVMQRGVQGEGSGQAHKAMRDRLTW